MSPWCPILLKVYHPLGIHNQNGDMNKAWMHLIHIWIKSDTPLPSRDSLNLLLLSMKNSCGLNTYGFLIMWPTHYRKTQTTPQWTLPFACSNHLAQCSPDLLARGRSTPLRLPWQPPNGPLEKGLHLQTPHPPLWDNNTFITFAPQEDSGLSVLLFVSAIYQIEIKVMVSDFLHTFTFNP